MTRLDIVADPKALAAAAAEDFAKTAESSTGPFRVALSGGETPKALYMLLATAPYRDRISWSRLHMFFGDERCVPPDHPDSNDRMAREALLSKVPLPPENVHRIEGELEPAQAASRYDALLRREFPALPPRFDLLYLGLGPEGHTASLFPGTPVLDEREKLAAAVWVEAKKTHRVTLTYPVLNAAKKVVFLIDGAEKAEAARRLVEGPGDPAFPASLVLPKDGELVRLLDRAAARLLRS
ncbi:MAG TPA: 6-phosphogluconolactonase [Elusimicrobiota bacterium]|jgi:6-phosphogluconolactonase|nr:6-phosphogluconolactonase [Elusimicrobiota bacterium]